MNEIVTTFIAGLLMAIITLVIGGLFVFLLWNPVMPVIFLLPKISFLQGIVLYALSSVLFGHNRSYFKDSENK